MPTPTYEYKVIKLGDNVNANAATLNKNSEEGWELVSTVPVQKIHITTGAVVSDVQAYLKRLINKKKTING